MIATIAGPMIAGLVRASGRGAGRLAGAALGLLALAGCNTLDEAASGAARNDWRVAERLGEVRYLPPGAEAWAQVASAAWLPQGSEVATGAGGRLIVADATVQVRADPESAFVLPWPERGQRWNQGAGLLRYRALAAGVAIDTPHLEIDGMDAVFDVVVADGATEITVEKGRVRIATPDGSRRAELRSGQSAYASGLDDRLAMRRLPGGPLEQVEAPVLPAIHPSPAGPSETPAASSGDSATPTAPGITSDAGLAPDGVRRAVVPPVDDGPLTTGTPQASFEAAAVLPPTGSSEAAMARPEMTADAPENDVVASEAFNRDALGSNAIDGGAAASTPPTVAAGRPAMLPALAPDHDAIEPDTEVRPASAARTDPERPAVTRQSDGSFPIASAPIVVEWPAGSPKVGRDAVESAASVPSSAGRARPRLPRDDRMAGERRLARRDDPSASAATRGRPGVAPASSTEASLAVGGGSDTGLHVAAVVVGPTGPAEASRMFDRLTDGLLVGVVPERP